MAYWGEGRKHLEHPGLIQQRKGYVAQERLSDPQLELTLHLQVEEHKVKKSGSWGIPSVVPQ